MARARSWIQLNASLARSGGSALPSARALFRALDARLPEWRRRRIVSHCFFQRKPPDLRLRFRGVRDPLTAELRHLLGHLAADGHVRTRSFSVYEPETRQFGGAACMAHVHAFWSLDTANWIALDRLDAAAETRLPSATLLSAILNDLFWATLRDGGEVWDTWCNLLALLGAEDEPAAPASDPPFPDSLMPTAGVAEALVLARYQLGGARLAAGLRDAWGRGRMSCGIRTILPHVAMFTLNRHGFDQGAATAFARDMATAWNPKIRLRGASAERLRGACPTCAARVGPPLLREVG